MHAILLALALCLLPTLPACGAAPGPAPALTPEDRRLLDGLLRDLLFDPKGAERVSFRRGFRSAWAGIDTIRVEGWRRGDRVHLVDSASIPAPASTDTSLRVVDFVAAVRARYAALDAIGDDEPRIAHFDQMYMTALGLVGDDDLVLAAWLHRVGEEELSARALAHARERQRERDEGGDLRASLRKKIARLGFVRMIQAYMVRADDEALAEATHLRRRFRADLDEESGTPLDHVVAEFRRRRDRGTFGKTPPDSLPSGFAGWDAARKTKFLVASLDEVDGRQWGQPAGVGLGRDPRIQALIGIGEPAVPALLDALERDDRLTRSVHFWRDFHPQRTVLSVREAALVALRDILRVTAFEPAFTGDNFTSRGSEAGRAIAARLRAYWNSYRGMSFDRRMMAILADPKVDFPGKREAARNLATAEKDEAGTIALRTRFEKPTAAEAILRALEADLSAHESKPEKQSYDHYTRREIEGDYLSALATLGDPRVAPALARRADEYVGQGGRWRWAAVAAELGSPAPHDALVDSFRRGTLRFLEGEAGEGELLEVMRQLERHPEASVRRALDVLADSTHAYHAVVRRQVRTADLEGMDGDVWFGAPFALRILERDLADTTRTGVTYRIDKDRMIQEGRGRVSTPIPEFLADPKRRRDRAEQRVADVAAERLSRLVAGVPDYHPLYADASERRRRLEETMRRYGGFYRRRANHLEVRALGRKSGAPVFLPEFGLVRPARHADVEAGRAIFHLDGKGRRAPLELPALARLSPAGDFPPRFGWIAQAEVDGDGRVTYGLVMREEVRTVGGDQVTAIRTPAEAEAEWRAGLERARRP